MQYSAILGAVALSSRLGLGDRIDDPLDANGGTDCEEVGQLDRLLDAGRDHDGGQTVLEVEPLKVSDQLLPPSGSSSRKGSSRSSISGSRSRAPQIATRCAMAVERSREKLPTWSPAPISDRSSRARSSSLCCRRRGRAARPGRITLPSAVLDARSAGSGNTNPASGRAKRPSPRAPG